MLHSACSFNAAGSEIIRLWTRTECEHTEQEAEGCTTICVMQTEQPMGELCTTNVVEMAVSPLSPHPEFWAVTGQQHECSGLHGSPSEFFGFVFFCLCNLFFPLLYSILKANVLLVEPGIHIHPNFLLFFCQLYFPNQTGQGSSGSKEAQVHLRKWEQETVSSYQQWEKAAESLAAIRTGDGWGQNAVSAAGSCRIPLEWLFLT